MSHATSHPEVNLLRPDGELVAGERLIAFQQSDVVVLESVAFEATGDAALRGQVTNSLSGSFGHTAGPIVAKPFVGMPSWALNASLFAAIGMTVACIVKAMFWG